ncbi:SUKH-4 family immunity protein [Streptomyces endophyticus]|uniref:SUKH-4 family immunity protein n=1 Tax=Streptomyces endophyticus TaxID=714166 RepID=A0ABU6F5V3_9ACTN|nr:SUKH-4 family immunity protein [Streptomyces endophyticus]MEB8339386.1 SUKH-4 family immunity protein [Streptomyces endophyticus]
MPEPTIDTSGNPGIPEEEVAGRVGAWWREGGRGGRVAFLALADSHDSSAVVRATHERVPGSVVVDATGLTAEQVMRQALTALGVDLSADRQGAWRFALGAWPEERLLLVVNAHRAGPTRRSYEAERLVTRTLPRLARGKLTVLVHVVPRLLPTDTDSGTVFRVSAPATEPTAAPDSVAVRALALAEPRLVPLPVWAQLVTALAGEATSEDELAALAREESGVLRLGPLGVSFIDEGLAEKVRRDVGSEVGATELRDLHGHVVDWLTRSAPDLRHPEGWARRGAVGLYAATGLAMHAVQAGTYEELLRDGSVVAQLPQTALMDAARSITFYIPGNTAAADAIHLWGWGVVPRHQTEWASWLHLMALSRNDRAFASAVASSGVALPWQAKWTKWRPPGGLHADFLEAGRLAALAEVRWQGRPAVAALEQRTVNEDELLYVSVRDMETGEQLAEPWEDDEIPEEHRADLTVPTASGSGAAAPALTGELFAASSPRRDGRAFMLPCPPLDLGEVTLFAGDLGLIAVEPTAGVDISGFGARALPLSSDYTDAGPCGPIDAPAPSHEDLITVFGEDLIYPIQPEDLPDRLTDPATRELLLEFGLPYMKEGAMGLFPFGNWEMGILDERPSWPEGIDPVTESGPFFQIGKWVGGKLVIDGPTGHVLRVPTEPGEDHLGGLPVADSLEEFLTMVAVFVTGWRSRDLAPPTSAERQQATYWVVGALAEVSETGGKQPAWSYVLHNT